MSKSTDNQTPAPTPNGGEPPVDTSAGSVGPGSQEPPQSSTNEAAPGAGAGLFMIERVEGAEIITGKTIAGKNTYRGWSFPEDQTTFKVPADVATVMIATGSFREVPQGPARLKKGD